VYTSFSIGLMANGPAAVFEGSPSVRPCDEVTMMMLDRH
jgi:hypothetical protein